MMKVESATEEEEKMKLALLSYSPQVPPPSSAFYVKGALRSAQISPELQHDELQIDRPDGCRSDDSVNSLSDEMSRCLTADPVSVTFTHDRPATMPCLLQLGEQDSKQTTLPSNGQPSTLSNYTLSARDRRNHEVVEIEHEVQREGIGQAVGRYFRRRQFSASQELAAKNLMGSPIPLIRSFNSTSEPDLIAQGVLKARDLAPSSIDGGTFVCDTPSPELMYRFKGVSGLYVGFEDKVRPLPAQLEKWQNRIKPRLLTDIQEFEKKMKKTRKARGGKPGLSPELRMSGYTVLGTNNVTLRPRIWILYDQEKWKKSVQAFVKELEWLECEGFGDIEVHKGCPMLATVDSWPFINGLDLDETRAFRLANGLALHLHVEKPRGSSACGLVCCATLTKDGTVTDQRLSRIGGLICVNDETFGITTAHGMLEWFWNSEFQDLESGNHSDDTESVCSSLDSDDTEPETSSIPDTTAGPHDDGTNSLEEDGWSEPVGSTDPQRIIQWDHVQEIGLTSFLGAHAFNLTSFIQNMGWSSGSTTSHGMSQNSGKLIAHSMSDSHHEQSTELYLGLGPEVPANRMDPALLHPPTEGSDFSLWGIPNIETLYNTYTASDLRMIKIEAVLALNDASDGPVQLLLGNNLAVDGILLPGNMSFIIHGAVFKTRKVRTSAPLARGCSGSWIVRDGQLCGVIIASYEAEPYVHMITSQDFMHDIQASSSQIRSIKLPSQHDMVHDEQPQDTHDANTELSQLLPPPTACQKPVENCNAFQQGRANSNTTVSAGHAPAKCIKSGQNLDSEVEEDHATRFGGGKTKVVRREMTRYHYLNRRKRKIRQKRIIRLDGLTEGNGVNQQVLAGDESCYFNVPSELSPREVLIEDTACVDLADIEGGHDLVHNFMTKFGTEPRRQYQAASLSTLIQPDTAMNFLARHWKLPSRTVAWVDDRTNDGNNSSSLGGYGPLTVGQFYLKLKEKRFHATQKSQSSNPPSSYKVEASSQFNADRRLIFITDLDRHAVIALMLTAPMSQARALGDVFYRHLAFESHIGATPYTDLNFSFFGHLSFYVWTTGKEPPRDPRTKADGSSLRKVLDLSSREEFLGQPQYEVDYLCEAQISILITGVNHRVWTGYCFVDTYYQPEGTRECVDKYCDDSVLLDGLQPDPLTAGTCDANHPILDPRAYFLVVLEHRLKELHNEWMHTADRFRSKIEAYIDGFEFPLIGSVATSIPESRKSLLWVARMKQVLGRLIISLNETIQCLDHFLDKNQFQSATELQSISSIQQIISGVRKCARQLKGLSTLCDEHISCFKLHALHFENHEKWKKARLQDQSQAQSVMMLYLVAPIIITAAILSMQEKAIPGFLGPNKMSFITLTPIMMVLVYASSKLVEFRSSLELNITRWINRSENLSSGAHEKDIELV